MNQYLSIKFVGNCLNSPANRRADRLDCVVVHIRSSCKYSTEHGLNNIVVREATRSPQQLKNWANEVCEEENNCFPESSEDWRKYMVTNPQKSLAYLSPERGAPFCSILNAPPKIGERFFD